MLRTAGRVLAVSTLAAAIGIALAACTGGGDESPRPPPTSTPEPSPPALSTRIEAVDRVVIAVENGDPVAFEALLRPQRIPCTNVSGAGGPPKCFDAPGTPAEGTLVAVFPYDTCEREWQFDLTAFTTRMLERLGTLYAAVRIDQFTPQHELPEGGYGIIYPDAAGFATAHALIVTNDGIVSVDSLCGGGAERFLANEPPFHAPEVILEGPAFE